MLSLLYTLSKVLLDVYAHNKSCYAGVATYHILLESVVFFLFHLILLIVRFLLFIAESAPLCCSLTNDLLVVQFIFVLLPEPLQEVQVG